MAPPFLVQDMHREERRAYPKQKPILAESKSNKDIKPGALHKENNYKKPRGRKYSVVTILEFEIPIQLEAPSVAV